MQATIHRRSSTSTTAAPEQQRPFASDLFSDSRFHGYQGPSRNVRLLRATASGGGTVAKSDDGARCVVAGRESLRVLRLSHAEDTPPAAEQRLAVGLGGHRVQRSRNLWSGSGLKIESTSTDVAWCSGSYSNKVLTSARNGDLIMWDLDKPSSTKYERKTRNHIRSIHKLSYSSVVPYYCITGSADGDMRMWDLRDMSRSVMKIHHQIAVRSLVFSPSSSHPLQAVVGLDNGSIYRWDLHMGQRGQLDRLPVAHTGPILSLNWCCTPVVSQGADSVSAQTERSWIVSGGLDHTVKVWDLPGLNSSSHISSKPMYVLHPSYPVRRILWRPDYPCELALVSNAEFTGGSGTELLASPRMQNATPSFLSAAAPSHESKDAESKHGSVGETVEIWDVRRGWIAKWTVDTNASDGGVTDAVFRDSHALLVQHVSGTFAQVDLRHSYRPIDAIPRAALSWSAVNGSEGTLAFVANKRGKWEVPYDDVHPDRRLLLADRNPRLKALGDKECVPGRQNIGVYVRVLPSESTGPDVFVRLAKCYVVPDKPTKRKEVCTLNADVALRAGNKHAAQAWMLLGSLLTDVVPESVTVSLLATAKLNPPYPLVHSISAPSALPSNEGPNARTPRPVSKPMSYHAVSADPVVRPAASPPQSSSQSQVDHHHNHPYAPRSTSNEDRKHPRHLPETQPPPPTRPPPNSRNLTPASSASSSPRHVPVTLPFTPVLPPATMMTPTTASKRRLSIVVSTASQVHSHVCRSSVYNRVTRAPSESHNVARIGDENLRYIGDDGLDDSDSSEGAASEGVTDRLSRKIALPISMVSKSRSRSAGRTGPVHPSPLSRRFAGRQHSVDEEGAAEWGREGRPGGSRLAINRCRRVEEDDASPSPVSSDTDGERSEDSEEETRRDVTARLTSQSITTRSRSRKGSGANARRWKSRSRGSTMVSLAAPLMLSRTSLSGPPPSGEPPNSVPGTLGWRGSLNSVETVIAASVRENEDIPADTCKDLDLGGDMEPVNCAEMSNQRRVVEQERRQRDAGWRTLREMLEEYANGGDVQMCAMLALVAPKELELDVGRTTQFVEAYVDMLVRYRLHSCAAYVRKYCNVEEIQKSTKLQTVIYTACRKCRKSVVAVRSRNPLVKATYAVCATCKEPVVRCSICHLPVRALHFQCSVCSHGGHQDCYRRYYMERPTVELSVPSVVRGRQQLQGEQDGENEQGRGAREGEKGLAGRPCAAGCGHFCWAVVGRSD